MRPVSRGGVPTDNVGNVVVFNDYAEARDPLINRIGDYCSYCEVALHSTIHVEHVRPKDQVKALARTWSNFLLACDSCNSVKGSDDLVLNEYYWPDTDNTSLPFVYELDRAPQVQGGMNPSQTAVAGRTLNLTGLNREPGHLQLTVRDRRWLKRREAWGVALNERRKIQETDTINQRDSAVQVAIARGFWSVWMTVFHDDLDMRQRLITGFRGTATDCFDQTTQPVQRPGGNI